MPEKITKKIDDLETKDSVIGKSKKLLSTLKKEVVDEQLSQKDVEKRYSDISKKIRDYWEGDYSFSKLEYKTIWEDGKEMEVSLQTSNTDGPEISTIIHKEGVTTYYSLAPKLDKKGGVMWYELTTTYLTKDNKGNHSETMKALSPNEAMKALDNFEKRLNEYRTQTFDKMQQYAKKEDDQVDKTDKLA